MVKDLFSQSQALRCDLYKLIIETSKLDMKKPSRELMEAVADKLSA